MLGLLAGGDRRFIGVRIESDEHDQQHAVDEHRQRCPHGQVGKRRSGEERLGEHPKRRHEYGPDCGSVNRTRRLHEPTGGTGQEPQTQRNAGNEYEEPDPPPRSVQPAMGDLLHRQPDRRTEQLDEEQHHERADEGGRNGAGHGSRDERDDESAQQCSGRIEADLVQ